MYPFKLLLMVPILWFAVQKIDKAGFYHNYSKTLQSLNEKNSILHSYHEPEASYVEDFYTDDESPFATYIAAYFEVYFEFYSLTNIFNSSLTLNQKPLSDVLSLLPLVHAPPLIMA